MTLADLAVRRPVTTAVLLLSVFVLGGLAVFRLPLAFMPDREPHNIFVIVSSPGSTPAAVERSIVRPLEDAFSSMPGLQSIWSHCDEDGGRLNLTFDWEVDMGAVRGDLRARIDRIRPDLPEDLEDIRISSSWNPRVSGETILEARLSSGRDLSRDYALLERRVLRPLERIPGVASVSLDGVNPSEVRIDLDRHRMALHRVDPRHVLDALRRNNLDRSVGRLRRGASTWTLRAIGRLTTLEEIRSLPIRDDGLVLGDVAEVRRATPPLDYGRHLDGRFAVGLSVTKESAANTVDVTREVRRRVEALRADPELEGISFLVWQDQGEEIERTLAELSQTGLIGGLLAALVLYAFLRNVGTTLVALLAIPFSLVVTCGVIWVTGRSLNTLSLLGLIVGVGMLVDNAVVVIESIHRHREQGLSPRAASLVGAREVAAAVMAATATSVIVFAPLIFNKPSEFNLSMRELALTVVFTLIASLVVSQTLIPLATSTLVKDVPRGARAGGPRGRWTRWYERLLLQTLRRPWIAPLVGVSLLATAWWPASSIDIDLDVSPSEMFVGMRYRFSEPLSLPEKEAVVTTVEEALVPLKEQLDVESIYSFWSERYTLTRLYMKEGFTNEAHMAAVRKALPGLLPKIAGVRLEVMDNVPFWQRTRGKRVAFRLKGPETEVLARIAARARRALATIPGLFDTYTTAEGGRFEVRNIVDRVRLRAYGVGMEQPGEVVDLTFRGRRLRPFAAADGEVPLRLVVEEERAASLDRLRSLPLLRRVGPPLPLEAVADVEVARGPEAIQRDDRMTSVWVGAKYDEGDKKTYMARARELLSQIELPRGYSWEFNPSGRRRRMDQQEFGVTLLLALGLILAVMAGLFESLAQAISLMVALPFAVVGAAWTLYLSGTSFDQPASVGLLLLLGVVVNNGIVMITHIDGYRRAGMSRRDAMLRGGRERLRPIVMTAVTTLFGLIPMIIQQPALGGVYYYSMAYVLAGGLALSTLLTTLLLPATVCLVEDVPRAIAGRLWHLVGRLLRRRDVMAPRPASAGGDRS